MYAIVSVCNCKYMQKKEKRRIGRKKEAMRTMVSRGALNRIVFRAIHTCFYAVVLGLRSALAPEMTGPQGKKGLPTLPLGGRTVRGTVWTGGFTARKAPAATGDVALKRLPSVWEMDLAVIIVSARSGRGEMNVG